MARKGEYTQEEEKDEKLSDSGHFVPDNLYRVIHHYHNLIYLKGYWESIGQQLDPIIARELERSHDVVMKVVERESQQGGSLRKMKEDKI